MSSKHINRPYLHTNETDLYQWLFGLNTNLPGLASVFNLNNQVTKYQKAFKVLGDTFKYQRNAKTLAEERTGNKNEAEWNPVGQQVLVRPNDSQTGPATIESSDGGAVPIAVDICDTILASDKCDQAIKDLLKLNPLPKPVKPAGKPQVIADIEDGQLTVKLAKGRFQYFIVKVDHGAGAFDQEFIVHETNTPLKDPAPLPTGEPQIWRVQAFGFLKGSPTAHPGDIIDVAAKADIAEHAEGAN
jgi:hypothetical protein